MSPPAKDTSRPDSEKTADLFDVEPLRQQKERRQYTKSVAQGKCPSCSRPKIGLVRIGAHLAWRAHTYTTWSKAVVECYASNIPVCILPEGKPSLGFDLRCTHERG